MRNKELNGKSMGYIYLQYMLYRGQGCDEAEAYLMNTGGKVRIHPRWDTSTSQGTMNSHSYQGVIVID